MSAITDLPTQATELISIVNPEIQERFVSVVEAIVNDPELAIRYHTGFIVVEDRRAGNLAVFGSLYKTMPHIYTQLNAFMKVSFVNRIDGHNWAILMERNTMLAIENEINARKM